MTSTPSTAPLLEIANAGQSFAGEAVFSGVTFRMSAGGNLLLTGPSGGGKSTLLRLVAGLAAPDEGEIRIDGVVVSQKGRVLVPPHQRQLSMVFQDLGLWPNLSAAENVLLGLAGAKLSAGEKRERAAAALAACGLEKRARARPARLSGGEQQRVALARAMAVRPRLLLLDEPFSGLDIALRHALLEQIAGLFAGARVTVLMASHNPLDARWFNAQVAVLEDGALREHGPLAALLENPRSRTMQAWRREAGGSGVAEGEGSSKLKAQSSK